MTIVTLPTSPAPRDCRLYIAKTQTVTRSFSGFKQVQKNPGDRWVGKITLPTLTAEQAMDWLGAFDALDGQIGTFFLPHPDFKAIRGTANGDTGAVKGAGQKGSEIITYGWGADVTFRRGDILQFDAGSKARMRRVTKDATANGSGEVTLDVMPPFIIAPDDNAAIKTTNCGGVFSLAESDIAPQSDVMRNHTISFAVEEVLK